LDKGGGVRDDDVGCCAKLDKVTLESLGKEQPELFKQMQFKLLNNAFFLALFGSSSSNKRPHSQHLSYPYEIGEPELIQSISINVLKLKCSLYQRHK
jgi:hypothetical protein